MFLVPVATACYVSVPTEEVYEEYRTKRYCGLRIGFVKDGGVYHGMREKEIGNGNNEKIKQCNENRRMNMKKIIAILLTTLLVMQMLVGCGSTTKNEENNTDTKNNEITEGSENLSWAEIREQIPKELKGTTVTVYSWNDANAALATS